MDENEFFKQMMVDESTHEFTQENDTLPLSLDQTKSSTTEASSRSGTLVDLFAEKSAKSNLSEELDEVKMQNEMMRSQIDALQLYIEKILSRIFKKRLEGEVFENLE
jgi:hypothetical protein